jgi:hypothetical protein
MFTVYEWVACVVVALTLSTFLCVFYVVLLTMRWGIERLWRRWGETQPDGLHFFSQLTVRDAGHRFVVDRWNALCGWCIRAWPDTAYRSPLFVASSDPLIRESHAQSPRYSSR